MDAAGMQDTSCEQGDRDQDCWSGLEAAGGHLWQAGLLHLWQAELPQQGDWLL